MYEKVKLYNTLGRKLEEFVPIVKGKVGIYVCGITPYNYAHIGNARPCIVFDTLYRFLKAAGFEVTYVHNFTDIDDKLIQASKDNGEDILAIADKFIDTYHQDMQALHVLGNKEDSNIKEPRVSQHIEDIIKLISELVANNIAYIGKSGDVLYNTKKFSDYGKLSRKNIDELIAGARVEVSDDKLNLTDFVLWKSAKEGEISFPSPWGEGRPGWHIECSAMSKCHLGETFDIHGGGEDLQFPHHENEIAQSEGANGKKYVNYWMHNAFITVNGEKMSKSLGNFTLIQDLLKKYSGEAIRLWMLTTHYRKPVDLSDEALQAAENSLARIYRSINISDINDKNISKLPEEFMNALGEDLNTPQALAVLFEKVKLLNNAKIDKSPLETKSISNEILAMGEILGLDLVNAKQNIHLDIPSKVTELLEARKIARDEKNWQLSDKLRDEIHALGYLVKDSSQGMEVTKI